MLSDWHITELLMIISVLASLYTVALMARSIRYTKYHYERVEELLSKAKSL